MGVCRREREEMMGRAEQLRECNAALREGLLAFADRIYPPPSAGASQEPITKEGGRAYNHLLMPE